MGRSRNPYRAAFDRARQKIHESIVEAQKFEEALAKSAQTIEEQALVENLKPGQLDKLRKQYHTLIHKANVTSASITTQLRTSFYHIQTSKKGGFGIKTSRIPKDVYANIHRQERVDNLLIRLKGYFGDEWLDEWYEECYVVLMRLSEQDLYNLTVSIDGLNKMTYESDASYSSEVVEIDKTAKEVYIHILTYGEQ